MPNFFNKYPYTDFHELNLDWVLETVKDDKERVDETVADYTQFKEDITEQQENFEGDMTRWKDGVDTDLADWKRDTNNDLDRWKTDTHNDFQGQIDDMDHAWDDFLNNYSRTFGIVNSFGSSTVDAITQAKATEIKENLDTFVDFPLHDYIMFADLRNGSYDSSGSVISPELTYRIRTRDIMSFSYPLVLVPLTGWRIMVDLYSSGVFTENIPFTTDEIPISAGQEFTFTIARETEDISETASVSEFLAGVHAQSKTAPMVRMEKAENAIDKFIPKNEIFSLCPMDFSRGNLNSSGNVDSLDYRIVNANILSYDNALNIICSNGSFSTSVAYYDEYNVCTKVIAYSKDDKYIAPGQKFRLCIKRDIEDPSEQANNRTFLAGVEASTLSAPYVPLSSYMNINGKIINFLGDSYVYNHNDPFTDTWCYKIARKHGAVGRNYGYNGYPITPATPGDHVCLLYTAQFMAPADYIVVVGGKNDYNVQRPLVDFKAGLHDLIDYLIANFLSSQICFFTPWRVTEQTEDDTGAGAKTIPLFDYIDAIKEVCAEYGVACYDSAFSGIYTASADFRHEYFQGDNDVSHLNPAGHDLFMPRAEKFLMNVLG